MTVIMSGDEHILLTPSEASSVDQQAIASGVPGLALMENAGRASAEVLTDYIGTPLETGGEIVILCGPGNNGGDGFVMARYLDTWGYPVRVLCMVDKTTLKGDAADMAKRWQGRTDTLGNAKLNGATVIVDCLFGTGLNKAPEGPVADLIAKANGLNAFRLAVDLPSGLDGSTGMAAGPCFQADATVTFSQRKPGQMVAPGRFFCGGTDNIHVVNIGVPAKARDAVKPSHFSNEPSLWGHAYPFQGPATHKYDRGHMLVLGGKEPTLGASRLAGMAGLRVGAGLVTLAAPSETYAIQATALTDIMVRRFDSAFGFMGIMSDARISSVLLGPGAGLGEKTVELVQQAGRKGRNMVLDADVLTSLTGRIDIVAAINDCEIVMTPHEGEFARLFPDLDFQENRIAAVREAATRTGTTVVLKGVSTLVAEPSGKVSIGSNAPSWLAVGGTGDVLAGMIAGLLAQGMPAFEAASAGVWMHGEAGMKAGRGLIASDLVSLIPSVLPG